MGQWYVIASIPSKIYDSKAYNATETYERAERGIKITYAFNNGGFDEKVKSFTARAMIADPGLNTNWEVTYVTWPFKRDYRILHVEDDYSAVVIGQPSRKTAWILARRKTIDDALYSDIILFLQDRGYHVGKIRKVPQR
jgi:apolipoprotein D and lipocalin family protein